MILINFLIKLFFLIYISVGSLFYDFPRKLSF